uniref:Uncharacterized protein n=1 Tax=Arundo donax TaxID=35708 RepID=A0A0A9DGF6_ARUDO
MYGTTLSSWTLQNGLSEKSESKHTGFPTSLPVEEKAILVSINGEEKQYTVFGFRACRNSH